MMNRTVRAGMIFIVALFILGSATAVAKGTMNQDKADVLNRMQLFNGTNKGYELDKAFTRAQGTVMLVRLLGWEDEALNDKGKQAFADVKKSHWAASYISYANNKGLVRGVTASKFAPDEPMNGAQFISLALRALGYLNATPSQALELAQTSGLLEGNDAGRLIEKKSFLRDDMVAVAYSALITKMNNKDITLLQKLVDEDHSVSRKAALASGLYDESTDLLNSNDPMDQIEGAIRKALHP